jgi:hypothetical protein
MGTGVSGYNTAYSFDELNEPLDTQEGVLSPSQRKERARINLGVEGISNVAAVTALTDSTGGTPSGTLASIAAGGTYAQADIVAIKNALASINAKLTEIITAAGAN